MLKGLSVEKCEQTKISAYCNPELTACSLLICWWWILDVLSMSPNSRHQSLSPGWLRPAVWKYGRKLATKVVIVKFLCIFPSHPLLFFSSPAPLLDTVVMQFSKLFYPFGFQTCLSHLLSIYISPLYFMGWLLLTSVCTPCGLQHLFQLPDSTEETILSSYRAMFLSMFFISVSWS